RLFPLSARTGTGPSVSTISTVSRPGAAAAPGGPPGARTANSALVTPGERTIFSRTSAYCTSGEPFRTGRTTMSIDAAGSTTAGPAGRCAAAGVTRTTPTNILSTHDRNRISKTPCRHTLSGRDPREHTHGAAIGRGAVT